MSDLVRVNLLPSEVGQKNAARRMQGLAGVAGLGIMSLLAASYFWQVGKVNDAKADLVAEESKADALRGEVQALSQFQRLASQGESVDKMIAALLSGEASLAGVLQDLAAVMPSDSSIEALSVGIEPNGTGGTFTSNGVSLLGHAPGLERLLISLDKVAAFDDIFFTTSTIDESGVATFSFNFRLTPLILTGRYVDGLPEVMR
ncbi:MAG: Tfp pilus assembly protein PilN [Glaciecola sp.]|jgi:Tfp pilus assembly protein PilN